MSGKPNRYASDPVKNRDQYMEALNLRASIDDMNLQANKTYKATGQLPPVSQMPETRTTTEILADNERLKIDLVKILAPIADSHFALAIIQRIQNSPLNSSGGLFTYFAQRAPEIVKQLQKSYSLKIGGNQDDVEKFVNSIEKMFTDSKDMLRSVSSFFSQPENKRRSITDLKAFEDIRTMFNEISRKLVLKVQPSHHLKDIIYTIAQGLKTYTKFLEIEAVNNIISKIIQYSDDVNNPNYLIRGPNGEPVNILDEGHNLFKRYQEIIEEFPTSNQMYELLDQLSLSIKNNNDTLSKTILINFASLLNNAREAKVLTNLLKIFDDQLRNVYNKKPHEFIPDDEQGGGGGGGGESNKDDSSRFILLLENENLEEPTRDKIPEWILRPEIPKWLYNVMKNKYPFLPPYKSSNSKFELQLYKPSQYDIPDWLYDVPDWLYDEIKIKYPFLPDRQLLIENGPQSEQSPSPYGPPPNPLPMPSRPTYEQEDEIPQPSTPVNTDSSQLSIETYITDLQYKINELEENVKKNYKTFNQINNHTEIIQHKLENKDYDSETQKNGLIAYLEKSIKSMKALRSSISFTETTIKQMKKDLEEKQQLIHESTGHGIVKRRGRPRGCGIVKQKPYSESVKAHASYDKGIMESPRFVKFGRYLVNNHKLNNDDIFALKHPSGGTIQEFPSVRLSKHLSNVIKKMVGGGVPSYNDLNGLSEPEKVYLHKVAKRSNIVDKFSIPAPDKDQQEKDIHEFEVLKGEIMAGNDSKELIKKFKLHLMKLSKMGALPKREVSEVMEELIQMGY